MSAEPNLTDRDTEQLSAYIDGALDESERAALEARLQTSAALRRELDALRHTVALVRELPPLKAPRDFTLTPAMLESTRAGGFAPARRRIIRFPAVSLVSAAASVVMIFLGALLLLGDTAIDTAAPAQVDAPPALASPDVVAVAATKTAVVVEEALVEALQAPDVETFDEALEAAAEIADEPDFVGEPDFAGDSALAGEAAPFALPDADASEDVGDIGAAALALPGVDAPPLDADTGDDGAGPMALEMPAPVWDTASAEEIMPLDAAAEPPSSARQMMPEIEVAVEEEAVFEAEIEEVADDFAEDAADVTPTAEPTADLLSEVIVDPEDTVSRDVLGGALILAGLGLLAFVVYSVTRRRSPPYDR